MVYRAEKKDNFTVMSNGHLRSRALSLRAKGLLCQMLSLPPDWDFSIAGLASINREGIDAVRSAMRELEAAGYVARRQRRGRGGRAQGVEYAIYETPPAPVDPAPVYPPPENPTQLSTDIPMVYSNNCYYTPPKDLVSKERIKKKREGKGAEAANTDFEKYRALVYENIGYSALAEAHKHDAGLVGELADLILETICTARATIRVAGDDYPAGLVRQRLLRLSGEHIEFVLDGLKNNRSDIRCIKKYLLAALFNAPSTMESYYAAKVAKDDAAEFRLRRF